MNWTKTPSVMTGGKPFFYTALTKYARYWVSWSRLDGAWSVSNNLSGSRADSGFKTAKEAMHYAESCARLHAHDKWMDKSVIKPAFSAVEEA